MAINHNSFGASTPTAPVNDPGFQDYGPTTPVDNADLGMGDPFGGPVMDDTGKTAPVIVGDTKGFTPVVGWLVCVDGPAEGTDYRIRAGYNYIGRGENMDICILGDSTIDRERHAMIAYDHKEKIYFFGPAETRSIVRKNDKMIMVPTELAAYDVVLIGSTKLMFVPLCGEHFNWKEDKCI